VQYPCAGKSGDTKLLNRRDFFWQPSTPTSQGPLFDPSRARHYSAGRSRPWRLPPTASNHFRFRPCTQPACEQRPRGVLPKLLGHRFGRLHAVPWMPRSNASSALAARLSSSPGQLSRCSSATCGAARTPVVPATRTGAETL